MTNSAKQLGKRGEDLAQKYLFNKGYEILTTNYRYKHAEIDLIVKTKELLVFVEVKCRSNTDFGLPECAVDEKQENRIIKAAEHFLLNSDWENNIRFDIISIIFEQGSYQIEHFEDAFG